MTSPALQYPEKIHPSLWRGSQLAHTFQKTISTGYPVLDSQLPGRGWPAGALIEIMLPRPGLGEIQLLKPALLAHHDDRNIIFLNPPHPPSSICLKQWFSASDRLYWITPDTAKNTLWAAEKILQHNTTTALLCWVNNALPASLHRLHLAARQSGTLFFCLRPAHNATHSSVAPLRLGLEPVAQGLNIQILKRRGPHLTHSIFLALHPAQTDRNPSPQLPHDSLDQHPSALCLRPAMHATGTRRHGPAAIHT